MLVRMQGQQVQPGVERCAVASQVREGAMPRLTLLH
jgi:hypothetical protein